MTFRSIFLGAIAALSAAIPLVLHSLASALAPASASTVDREASWLLSSPVFVLGITGLAAIGQRYLIDRTYTRRSFSGIADLLLHIHLPSVPDSAFRWFFRGMISLGLSIFGGSVGPEGAAVELSHGAALQTRNRSARWFEQQRRTDAASALSGGVAAAFGAPFAAVLLPLELGLGGSVLATALSAVTAFLGVRYLGAIWPIDFFDIGNVFLSMTPSHPQQWLVLAVVAAAAAGVAALFVTFVRYTKESLLETFQTQAWIRIFAAGFVLFLVGVLYRRSFQLPSFLLEDLLIGRIPPAEASLLFFSKTMVLTLVLAGFGTIGVLWPSFALGGFFGFALVHALSSGSPPASFLALSALIGASAFFGALFRAPVSVAVLSFELTRNLQVIIPCFAAAWLAQQLAARLKTPTLVEKELQTHGLELLQGRSRAVLDSLRVRDAMITDFEAVDEKQVVGALRPRTVRARYPFIPVLGEEGRFSGLLTIDLIEQACREMVNGKNDNSGKALSDLFQVKDLLYRSGFSARVVREHETLAVASATFGNAPCLPVLDHDDRLVGLLFVHHVRLAYEREVTRRSLAVQSHEV